MSSFWQFLVDLCFLGVMFSTLQYLGFLVLFVVFVFEVGRIYIHIKKEQAQLVADKDDFVSVV